VLFRSQDWTSASNLADTRGEITLVDAMLHDQELDRLYSGSPKEMMRKTRLGSAPIARAAVVTAAGSSSGILWKPGLGSRGTGSGAWRAGHRKGLGRAGRGQCGFSGRVYRALCAKDHGWLAAYFDALSRVGPRAAGSPDFRVAAKYSCMTSIGGRATGSSANAGECSTQRRSAGPVSNRLQWQPDGSPYIPGGLAVWKEILSQNYSPKLVRDW